MGCPILFLIGGGGVIAFFKFTGSGVHHNYFLGGGVSEYEGECHSFTLFFRFCMFCAYTRPRYQVSIYRTLVLFFRSGGG